MPQVDATNYQAGPGHPGAVIDPAFVPEDLVAAWSVRLPGRLSYPLVVDRTVFVDAEHVTTDKGYPDEGTDLYAVDLDSGRRLWGPVDLGGHYHKGNVVYEGARLFGLSYDGRLTALDAGSGGVLWSRQLPQQSYTAVPVVRDGVLYAVGTSYGATLSAVSVQDGSSLWTVTAVDSSGGAPVVDATGVYLPTGCGEVRAFTLSGLLRWRVPPTCVGGLSPTPVLAGDRLYVRDDTSVITVLDTATGAVRGRTRSATVPAVQAGTVLAAHDTMQLRLDDLRSGTTRWSRAGSWSTAPLLVNGDVVAGAVDGSVSVLDGATGRPRWTGSVGTSLDYPDETNALPLSGMAVARGHLVVAEADRLTAFATRPARADPCAGPGLPTRSIRLLYVHLHGPCGFLGLPLGPERASTVRGGRWVDLRAGSIFWSPTSGAHEVHGSIGVTWRGLRAEGGPLGYPLTDELALGERAGALNRFQGGWVVWSPPTGAQDVRGSIGQLWSLLGAEDGLLGLPVTGETRTPDRPGAYNHFEASSVYWSSRTGAHEVHGSIREAWARLGWENSALGFPTSDEHDHLGGRRSTFEHGTITWTPDGNVVVRTT